MWKYSEMLEGKKNSLSDFIDIFIYMCISSIFTFILFMTTIAAALHIIVKHWKSPVLLCSMIFILFP